MQLDACPTCLVLWFDSGELEKTGLSLKSRDQIAARSLADLALEFQAEDAELNDTTNLLWLFAYKLRYEFMEMLYGRYLP